MRRTLLAAVALIAIAAACSVLPAASPTSPGQAARDKLVLAYLTALENRDADTIARMVSPGVAAGADIAMALHDDGGRRLNGRRISYRDDFGGAYVVATVVGTDDSGISRTIAVPLARVGDTYYIALGQATPSGSEANPSSPTP